MSTADSATNDAHSSQALSLPAGTVIVTKTRRFQILETLQKSVRRAVYVVSCPQAGTDARYVCKVEHPNKTSFGVRREKQVAVMLQRALPIEAERFAEFIDYGESKLANFIVWRRLGPSLDELHSLFDNRFSLATSTRVNVQTLRALQKLHALGFIHRNVQPAHFVVGEPSRQVVYLVSFSLARRFRSQQDCDGFRGRLCNYRQELAEGRTSKPTPKNEVSAVLAREVVPAQQYFAPRFWYHSQKNQHMSRLDDVEAWLFMSLHLVDPQALPWAGLPPESLTDIYESKVEFMLHMHSAQVFSRVPWGYRRIIDIINARYGTYVPDYDKLIALASKVAQQACPNHLAPYDWEERPAPLVPDMGKPVDVKPTLYPSAKCVTAAKKTAHRGSEDPEMDRLVENWQNNFRKLILAGVPRAEAYRRVMGITHPPELKTGHWKSQRVRPEKHHAKTPPVPPPTFQMPPGRTSSAASGVSEDEFSTDHTE